MQGHQALLYNWILSSWLKDVYLDNHLAKWVVQLVTYRVSHHKEGSYQLRYCLCFKCKKREYFLLWKVLTGCTKLVLLSGKIPVWVSSGLGSDLTFCGKCIVQVSDYKVNTKYCFRVELKLSRASAVLLLPSLLSVLVHRLRRPKLWEEKC